MIKRMLPLSLVCICACSEPMELKEARRLHIQRDLAIIRSTFKPPSEAISLENAKKYALHYNLDYAIQKIDLEIKHELVTGSKRSLLPSLIVEGEKNKRNNNPSSISISEDTGKESLEPSYSQDPRVSRANAELAWSTLDFGISYFTHRQALDRTRIDEKKLQRARQNLILEVSRAYWRVMISREATYAAGEILTKAVTRQKKLQEQVAQKIISAHLGLQAQKDILLMRLRLERFERALAKARGELGLLMGIEPGASFTLVKLTLNTKIPPLSLNARALENEALATRPELIENDLQERISADAVRIEMTKLWPNANLFAQVNADKNKYLTNPSWYTVGITASWDLLSLPKQFSAVRSAELREKGLARKSYALAAAIMTQVNLAIGELYEQEDSYLLTKELYSIQKSILASAQNKLKAGEFDPAELLKIEAETLFVRVRFITSYSDFLIASERLENTLGRDNFVIRLVENEERIASLIEYKKQIYAREIKAAIPQRRNFNFGNND